MYFRCLNALVFLNFIAVAVKSKAQALLIFEYVSIQNLRTLYKNTLAHQKVGKLWYLKYL